MFFQRACAALPLQDYTFTLSDIRDICRRWLLDRHTHNDDKTYRAPLARSILDRARWEGVEPRVQQEVALVILDSLFGEGCKRDATTDFARWCWQVSS